MGMYMYIDSLLWLSLEVLSRTVPPLFLACTSTGSYRIPTTIQSSKIKQVTILFTAIFDTPTIVDHTHQTYIVFWPP